MDRVNHSSSHDASVMPGRRIMADTLFDGRLICYQYEQGYRFSIDAVLLGHFPLVRAGETILDLGTGCGILGLILVYRHGFKNISVTGMDRQLDLVECAARNCIINDYTDRFRVVHGMVERIEQLFAAESFSLVVTNPPFFPAGSGRTSRDTEANTARHQSEAGLRSFINAAAYCAKNRGRVACIYPANQVAELIVSLRAAKLETKKVQFIFSYPETTTGARLVLVEAVKNGGPGVWVLPPCYLYSRRNGPYSEAVRAMYQP